MGFLDDLFYGKSTATVKTNQVPDYETPAKDSGLLPPSVADEKVRRARLMELSRLLSGRGRKSTFLTDGMAPLPTGGPTTAFNKDFGTLFNLPTLGRPTTLGGGG